MKLGFKRVERRIGEMPRYSNCASKTTSESENKCKIWSFIAFALCHNKFGSVLNSFNFVHSKSWSREQICTKFDHFQIVQNSHGILETVLKIGMLDYFLCPGSFKIKIEVKQSLKRNAMKLYRTRTVPAKQHLYPEISARYVPLLAMLCVITVWKRFEFI